VFDGNTGDPSTLAPQIEKLKQRFHLDRVVLVGDRGMITEARITEDLKAAGLDWITALRAPAIKELVNSGALQLTLFDQRDMASIASPDFPGERLIVCRNPELAAERTRKREELLAATEKDLGRIKIAVGHRRDRTQGRRGAQHLQDEKAFRSGYHRRRPQLHPQDRRDRRRGGN
jgi:transposase